MNRKGSAGRAALFLMLLLLAVAFPAEGRAGLRIYFLRHGEAGHNLVKQWEGKPKSEWPVYVGKEDMFSPQGEEQVATVGSKLAELKFDLIACSPLWRTRHTILPYLKEHQLKAEIWPELEEIDYKEGKPLPPPSAALFDGGKEIELPEDEKNWLSLRDGVSRRIKVDTSSPAQIQADAKALMARNVEMLRSRFGGKDATVLLVGHGSNGSLLYRALTGTEKPEWPGNAKLWMVEEQADGSFKLRLFNDKVFK